MKRLIFLLLVILLLAGCTQNSETSSQTDSSDSQASSEVIENSSDSFPESWIGKWECIKSELEAFMREGEEVEFYDYKNRVTFSWSNDTGHLNTFTCWAKYDESHLSIYYDDFEGNPDYEFEIVKYNNEEIKLFSNRHKSEVILKKIG